MATGQSNYRHDRAMFLGYQTKSPIHENLVCFVFTFSFHFPGSPVKSLECLIASGIKEGLYLQKKGDK